MRRRGAFRSIEPSDERGAAATDQSQTQALLLLRRSLRLPCPFARCQVVQLLRRVSLRPQRMRLPWEAAAAVAFGHHSPWAPSRRSFILCHSSRFLPRHPSSTLTLQVVELPTSHQCHRRRRALARPPVPRTSPPSRLAPTRPSRSRPDTIDFLPSPSSHSRRGMPDSTILVSRHPHSRPHHVVAPPRLRLCHPHTSSSSTRVVPLACCRQQGATHHLPASCHGTWRRCRSWPIRMCPTLPCLRPSTGDRFATTFSSTRPSSTLPV